MPVRRLIATKSELKATSGRGNQEPKTHLSCSHTALYKLTATKSEHYKIQLLSALQQNPNIAPFSKV
jgi:hypothetical protein